jgi:hypothetical protein
MKPAVRRRGDRVEHRIDLLGVVRRDVRPHRRDPQPGSIRV